MGRAISFIGGETGLMLVLFCWNKKVGQRLALVISAMHAWFSVIKATVKRPRLYSEYPGRVNALALVEKDAPATDDVVQKYYTSLGLLVGAVIAIWFEWKCVNYEDTRNVFAMILRTAGVAALYFVLNTLLKKLFNAEFPASDSLASLMVRTGRYVIIMFLIIGVYPLVFPLYEKIGKKK